MGLLKLAIFVVGGAIAVKYLCDRCTVKKPYHFGGKVDPQFKAVENAFKHNFMDNDRDERQGASYAVYYKGKMVVDLWGGYADKDANRVWEENTISTVFSSTKAVCALIAAVYMDKGLLDPKALVTKYWPEFGKHGKGNATVEMLLSHQAGLVGIDKTITIEETAQISKPSLNSPLSKHFEEQVPNWPVGTAQGYHAITFGWLVDALIRRVDPKHRSLGTILKEDLAPLVPGGIDFHIGLPMSEFYRVARMSSPTTLDTIHHLMRPAGLYVAYKMGTADKDISEKMIKNPSWYTDLAGGSVILF